LKKCIEAKTYKHFLACQRPLKVHQTQYTNKNFFRNLSELGPILRACHKYYS